MTVVRRYMQPLGAYPAVAVESNGDEARIYVGPELIAKCDVDGLLRLLLDSRNAAAPEPCPVAIRWVTRPAGDDAPAVFHELRCSLASPHSGDHLYVAGAAEWRP